MSKSSPGGAKILRVLALAEKRGPTSFATLYEDLTPEQPKEIAPPALNVADPPNGPSVSTDSIVGNQRSAIIAIGSTLDESKTR